jgi:hypothetical protein
MPLERVSRVDSSMRRALFLLLSLSVAVQAQDGEGLPLPSTKHTRTAATAAKAVPDFTTDFDPKKDAPLFANNGDYKNGGGDCFGMSLVAIDDFIRRKNGGAARGPDKVSEHPAEGDLAQKETAAIVATEANAKDNDAAALEPPSHAKPIMDALERIQKTGLPEPFFIDAGKGRGEDGHVTVLYGAKDGKLLFYDPNFPGETIAWPFDPKKGLGPHPKAGHGDPFYGHINAVGSVPFDKLQTSKGIGAIKQACSAGASACVDQFPKVTVKLSPAKKEGEVQLSGTVSRGEKKVNGQPTDAPAMAFLKIDGKLRREPVRLAKNGSFSIDLPRSSLRDTSEVTVVATTKTGALAGYVTEKLSPPSSSGFVKELDKAGAR